MLVLSKRDLDIIRSNAERAYPRECCGLLGGQRETGSWIVRRVSPLENVASPSVTDRYVIDPRERHGAEERLACDGLTLVGFYHSHPDHEAYFSKTDLENSEEFQFGRPWLPPTYAYLVISVKKSVANGVGVFVIREGVAESIDVSIKVEEEPCPLK